MNEFWDIAYRDNAPILLGVLRRYIKETDIAQDLLQDIFITAIGKYDGYTGKGSFEGWLYRIAVNTALMHIRNEKKKKYELDIDAIDVETWRVSSLNDDTNEEYDTHPNNAKAIIEAADFSSEELLCAIDRLPEHHKLVFNMYVIDGFTHKEIATELNISAGTSKSHLKRARKKVQQLLYDDAMNKKKKKDKRRAAAFLLLFPTKEHYIDKMYRSGFSEFTIQPTGNGDFLSAAIEQNAISTASQQAAQMTAQQAAQSATFWSGKMSSIVACCGTAAVTIPICWLSMSVNSPLNKNDSEILEQINVIDTLIYNKEMPTMPDSVFWDMSNQPDKEVAYIINETDIENENVVPQSSQIENDAAPSEPVVILKQIIEQQTVIVRDTVFIIENEE